MLPKHIHATVVTCLLIALCLSATVVAAQIQDPVSHPKFVVPLPIPGRIDATTSQKFVMSMGETTQWLGLVDVNGDPLNTVVWGYGLKGQPVSFPGPTFEAMKNVKIKVKWRNDLPATYDFPNGANPHLLPVDVTLHMARPNFGGIPVVAHLHGGHTESDSDGLPEQWFTQGFAEKGSGWMKKTFVYHNDQEAATLWYHDHALGITRLNTYAGLAGFYLLRDKRELDLTEDNVLPGGKYEIEIVIQDRDFDTDGSLFFPSTDPEIDPGFDELPAGPSAIAEFFGHYILVNGKTWPKLDVEQRKYRLRYLNGSDSRFYRLELHDALGVAQEFLQIGTDDGLLHKAVPMTQLLLAPGERADLVVDFGGQGELTMVNLGPDEPFKGLNPDGTNSDGEGGMVPPSDPTSTGLIMKFNVNPRQTCRRGHDASVCAGTRLRAKIQPLEQTGSTRQLVLFEGRDNYGRLEPMLGTMAEGSKGFFEPITENPMLNDVEVWEIYNSTADAHPIHLHLVSFQIINRESFAGELTDKEQPQASGAIGVGGILNVTSLGGDARPPAPNEQGWKDTAVMLPGEVTRVIAKFDREGRYVWHCHILSHEEHDMMRPYYVGPMPMAAPMAVAAGPGSAMDVSRSPKEVVLEQNYPNPFNPTTQIRFYLPSEANVALTVYNVAGQEVRTLANDMLPVGEHVVTWDGRDNVGNTVSTGVYFYKLISGNTTHIRKMVMLK